MSQPVGSAEMPDSVQVRPPRKSALPDRPFRHRNCVVFDIYPRPNARGLGRRLAYCRTGRYRIRL